MSHRAPVDHPIHDHLRDRCSLYDFDPDRMVTVECPACSRHAVIFDIDDTLLHSMADDDRLYREAIVAVAGPVEFRASLADYEHVSDSGILREVLRDNRIEETVGLVDAVRQHFLRSLTSFVSRNGPFREVDGARELLARLGRSKTHAVGLATGSWRPSAELKLATAGFDVDGLPLATSDDAPERTAIMRHALAALGDSSESVTYYGDGVWDRRACEGLGWRFRPVGPALDGIPGFRDEFPESDVRRGTGNRR
ncbi:MAG: HAD family hydrolase [Woeseiaceae bacterium]|nr:HAD family hydrolase [Woeseiaceae bacterium]